MTFAINSPELLGLENDDTLFNWLHYRSPERGESLLHAVSDPTSGLGRLCFAFASLQTTLRTAEGDLIDTVAAIERCRATARALSLVLSGTRVVCLDTGEEVAARESLIRLSVAERVLDYIEFDRSIVPMAHRLVWGSKEEFRSLDDRFILDAETHLGSVALFQFGSSLPWQWVDGLRFGFNLVIQLNGIELPSHSNSAPFISQDWFNDLCSFRESRTSGWAVAEHEVRTDRIVAVEDQGTD